MLFICNLQLLLFFKNILIHIKIVLKIHPYDNSFFKLKPVQLIWLVNFWLWVDGLIEFGTDPSCALINSIKLDKLIQVDWSKTKQNRSDSNEIVNSFC